LGELVAPREKLAVLDDEPDNRILECAATGRADVITRKHASPVTRLRKIATEAHSSSAPSVRLPYQMRPGSRVVTSWTSHALPSGSLKA